VDVGLGVFVGEEEELGDDEAGEFVGDGPPDEDDAVLEEAGVDVVGAFAAGGLLDGRARGCVREDRGDAGAGG
jgi:hypothetical protein